MRDRYPDYHLPGLGPHSPWWDRCYYSQQMRTRPSPSILVPLLREDPDFSGLSDPAHWHAVQEAALAHRMQALIAFAVRSHVSAANRAWCDRMLTECWQRHDRNILNLDQALEIMARAKIEVLALKGPILGRRHFQPPFLRRISVDIDLAVRDRDLERAVAALAGEGFTPGMSAETSRRTSHHLALSRPGAAVIELHTKLSKLSVEGLMDDLFARATHHELPTGRLACIPCPADEMLGLFEHLAGDRFGSFSHLYELRRIWRASDAGLRTEVLAAAQRYRVSASVWLTHIALQTYWGERLLENEGAIPRSWLHGTLNEAFLHRMERNVAQGGERTAGARLEGRWLDLHMTESPAEALRMAGLITAVAFREALSGRLGTVPRPEWPA